MPNNIFDRTKHTYHNEAFVELVKNAVRFFNGSPVHTIPPPEHFLGAGVYALYYIGDNPLYQVYSQLNRLSYNYPIYVGKAVPTGWRQSRVSQKETKLATELFSRLKHHSNNIAAVDNLSINDFMCRFIIFESDASDMISTVEAALIKLNRPLWNSVLDGFGNHDPGRGRYEQANSAWDIVHQGRTFAKKLKGIATPKNIILNNIATHLNTLSKPVDTL